MYVIKTLPEFDAWLKGLSDKTAQRRLVARLRKASLGNLGDVKPVGWVKVFATDRHRGGATTSRDDRGGLTVKRKKIKASDLPEFDAAEYLDSEEAVAEYLTAVLAENDTALLAAALGDIARARGMSEIAKSTGLAREALYKALRPGAQPRFDTVSRVCTALGVRLVAEPVS